MNLTHREPHRRIPQNDVGTRIVVGRPHAGKADEVRAAAVPHFLEFPAQVRRKLGITLVEQVQAQVSKSFVCISCIVSETSN